jgi:hypothetical protein
MNTDSYFEIGYSHIVCEDYALSGTESDIAYAIISDGCSSSDHSDIGARLLSHIAKDTILYFERRKLLYDSVFMTTMFKKTFEEIIIKKCLEVKETLRLPIDVFDATLLTAIAVNNAFLYLYGRGDGCFIFKTKDNQIDFTEISFESNAPYYLSYDMHFDKKQSYTNSFHGTKVNIHQQNESICSNELVDADGFSFFLPLCSAYKQVALTSDGIGTYESDPAIINDKMQYPTQEIIPQYVDYKNPVGEFVQRRMLRLKKDCIKDGIVHQDDISCATINF